MGINLWKEGRGSNSRKGSKTGKGRRRGGETAKGGGNHNRREGTVEGGKGH